MLIKCTKSVVNAISKFNTIFIKALKGFLATLMALLLTAMTTEVITRYFFNTSLFGLEYFVGYFAVWLYMIGSAYGSYERSHIKADFINQLLKGKRARNSVRSITAAISTFISFIFTKWSYIFCMESIQTHEVDSAHNVPMIYFHMSLLIGALLMTIYFLIESIDFAIKSYRDTA